MPERNHRRTGCQNTSGASERREGQARWGEGGADTKKWYRSNWADFIYNVKHKQVFHCVVAMDAGTFMNACMSSLEVCLNAGGWGGGGLLQQTSAAVYPPKVWVIPRCRDMPRQVTHCSRATTLGGAAGSSYILNLQSKLCQTQASTGRKNWVQHVRVLWISILVANNTLKLSYTDWITLVSYYLVDYTCSSAPETHFTGN